ncbi:hypothetical protein HanXRQr2_Chr16g0773431 [Helianthus annuus]|uniref:Uncharacterized protein n=1 Tax=Helianthus annuus TaxID=4232 RepID=A0A9K3DVA4_HELAN|nr:hypothetical protein HanXRQr2_Chr16g0773431 [Helianthus annuus]KAJ0823275.1 hypothetical protein HanPSC8_Chr16g0741841 [Helianthus annuus]
MRNSILWFFYAFTTRFFSFFYFYPAPHLKLTGSEIQPSPAPHLVKKIQPMEVYPTVLAVAWSG